MTLPTPTALTPRWRRRLLILAGVAAAVVLILLVVFLAQRFKPLPEIWLRIAPVAATVEDAAKVAVSSGGWQKNEAVALCLNAPGDAACDEASALQVDAADASGNLNLLLPAGPHLAEGRTVVIALGLDSGRQASRAFRVLRAADGPTAAGNVANGDGDAGLTDLTPIAGGQDTDETPAPVAGVWAAEYFANPELAGPPALTREESDLAFDWGAGSPDPALPADGFAARWTRRLTFPAMTHEFQLQANGGARLFVDDQLLIDLWQDDGVVSTASASIDLTSGEHTLRVEYFDQSGDASISLRWQAADPYPDWRGEYFTNPDLAGEPALVRNDPDLNLNWGEESPAPGIIPADGFSARWSRTLELAPGLYRFVLTADEGGRLSLEGRTVIDAWQSAAGDTITADQPLSGGEYRVVVEHRDVEGPASIAVGWSLLTATTPAPLAAGDPSPTPSATPRPEPTATPDAPGAATVTPSPTPSPENTAPAATETPTPTSSLAASPTESNDTPTSTPTADATPGAATATPTTAPSTAPLMTPAAGYHFIEINPSVGQPGQEITITSGNWSPGTVVRVSLGEFNTSYTQATPLAGVSFTTPLDSAQPWSFKFIFPNQPPWSTQIRPVQIWVHNAAWTEWGRDLFDFDLP